MNTEKNLYKLKKKIIFLPLLISVFIFFSCRKENFMEGDNLNLEFSTDTVQFDTVFTTIGSATQNFRVINPYNKPILISSIYLAKGNTSNFRINVNGVPGNANDIEIGAKDSLYIFVEVTVNPDRDEMIEQDSIIFTLNGNSKDVKLVAYGQDVILIDGYILKTQTFTKEKPYLIYNSAAVDSNAVLTIEAGSHLHFHRNSGFYVWGTLVVNGTVEEPVIFEGDRLEYDYFDVPGQWQGIHISKISKNNYINNAQIMNAIVGLQVDSTHNNSPQLTILNSKIEHHSFAGIYAQMSSIFAANCLFSDCGYYSLALMRGGDYNFYNCTFGNFWSNTIRQTPSVVLNNYIEVEDVVYLYSLKNAYFGNCIIWGNQDTEIGIDNKYANEGADFNYLFENCLIKYDTASKIDISQTLHFKDLFTPKEFNFKDYYTYDFQLDTLSPAQDKASLEILNKYPQILNNDLNGFSRLNDKSPDIGAYERIDAPK